MCWTWRPNSRIAKIKQLALCSLVLAGCETLPADGPSIGAIEETADLSDGTGLGIEIYDLNGATVAAMGKTPLANVYAGLGSAKAGRAIAARSGDRIAIRIWEVSPDGLFSSHSEGTNLIETTVSRDGDIFVPYVGEMVVRGLGEKEIRAKLLTELAGKASDPQIQVEILSSPGNSVSITGGVAQPGQYPLQSGELELLDAISVAGGTQTPKHETRISLLRDGRTRELMLSDVFADPRNNVTMQPGDVLELSHLPRRYTAFGAVRRSGQVDFPSEVLTLEQALARSGGLNAIAASTTSVFLFRFENSRRLAGAGLQSSPNATTPAIYRINMSEPSAFFWARGFEVQDNDVLYVATAPASELSKFLTMIVTPLLGNASSISVVSN